MTEEHLNEGSRSEEAEGGAMAAENPTPEAALPADQPDGESVTAPPTGTGEKGPEEPLSTEAQEEQLLYAKILEVGMLLGLGLLLVTFALYLARIVPPAIPIEQLSEFWTMNVHDFLESINEHFLHQEHLLTGWAWLSQVGKGDFLNFVPIAILSAITIVCFIGITPVLARKKDWAFMIMALAEAAILILAASGLLAVGH